MRILLTNDDGIHAPGLAVLAEALRERADLTIVAPAEERSGISNAITLNRGMTPQPIHKAAAHFGTAIDGNPADCVKLALLELLDAPPDLVISGINLGQNAGISIIYSGTVAGATEGTLLDLPSIALSLATFEDPHWETAARVALDLVDRFERHGLATDSLLNVNIPNRPYEDLAGYAVTTMAHSRYVNEFHQRPGNNGDGAAYWIAGELNLLDDRPDADVRRLREGYISLTPLQFDLTAHDRLASLTAFAGG